MSELECDIAELVGAFSELLPLSEAEKGQYWLRHTRDDGLTVTLILSIYESLAGIILKKDDVEIASLSFSHCKRVRLGGRSKDPRAVEIVGVEGNPNAYCVVRLDNVPVITFEDRSSGEPYR